MAEMAVPQPSFPSPKMATTHTHTHTTRVRCSQLSQEGSPRGGRCGCGSASPAVSTKDGCRVCGHRAGGYGCTAASSAILKVRIPITEPTMLWVAPGWRPPPYPQALACALPAHAAHARARPRTPRARARAPRARPRTSRARPRTSAHAALRGTAQVPSRSDSLTLRFPHAQIPCKGVPRYATGRDGVRSCGAGRGLAREGAGKCPRVWGWVPPWGATKI